jgi:hypothetical protein
MKAGVLFILAVGRILASGAGHALFAEAGGPGIVYSVNYDYRPLRQASLRTGIGCYRISFFGDPNSGCSIPVGVEYLHGRGRHLFEVGGGSLAWIEPFQSKWRPIGWGLHLNAGYRYQPPGRGVFFRAAFTPIITLSHVGESNFRLDAFPWLGLSAGYSIGS